MRRRTATKREQTPDVKYKSVLVGRLINTIMIRGKKSTAQNIVYGALMGLASTGLHQAFTRFIEKTEE